MDDPNTLLFLEDDLDPLEEAEEYNLVAAEVADARLVLATLIFRCFLHEMISFNSSSEE